MRLAKCRRGMRAPRLLTKQSSFETPPNFTDCSAASAARRLHDGSLGVKLATRASYRSHPVAAFHLLRAYSAGGDFIASSLNQRGSYGPRDACPRWTSIQ